MVQLVLQTVVSTADFLPTLPLLQNAATCAYCHDSKLQVQVQEGFRAMICPACQVQHVRL